MNQALRKEAEPVPELPPPSAPQPPLSPPRAHKRRMWLAAAAIIGLSVTAALKVASGISPPAPLRPLPPVERQVITALGWLEPESEIVKLAAPATAEASRIARLEVKEGDRVEAGHIVAILDTVEKLAAQTKSAEAQVTLKRVMLDRVRVDTENSIVAKRMAIARAAADLAQANAEYARQKTLVGREFATPANLEKRQRDVEVAKAQNEEAQSALNRLEAKAAGRDAEPTQIDSAIAELELAAAEADLAQTRVLLEQTSIRAPISGRVLKVLTRAGEKIDSSGILELGSVDTMMAKVEVYQSDIGSIHVGQPVEITSDALTSQITGVVERVGLKVKRQSVINNDPATDTDARVIEVRVRLDPASSERVSNLSLLQVRAHFSLGGKP